MNKINILDKVKSNVTNFFQPKGVFDKNFVKKPLIMYLIFGLLLLAIPFLQEQGYIQFYTMGVFGMIIIYTIVALGLNLLLGYSGLISLGTAGFIGFGAYGLPFFSNLLGLNFTGALIVTLLLSALIGALIGLFSLKVEGVYLAIATLFVGEIFLEIFRNVEWFTNGFSGVKFHYPHVILLFFQLRITVTSFILLVLSALIVIALGYIGFKKYKNKQKSKIEKKENRITKIKSRLLSIFKIALIILGLMLVLQIVLGEPLLTFVQSGNSITTTGFRGYLKLEEFDRNQTFRFISLILIASMFIIYNIVNSRTGRALMAMSRSEHAAQSMGISLMKYRLVAFITATVFATLAGTLYVSWFTSAYPDSWTLGFSLILIAVVVVGGYKSIFGMFLGALIIHGIPTFYLKEAFADINGLPFIFTGVLIIVVILFYPYGAIYLRHDIKRLYRYLKSKIIKFIHLIKQRIQKSNDSEVNEDE